MLTHWNKIIATDCTVIKVGSYIVYPIHRVGFTSLMSVADTTYVNEQISDLDHINVLIREPESRFVSGVNEYCRQNKLDVLDTYEKIKNHQLVDSHFMPQYIWLMNLYRFFRGEITIRPFGVIANITSVHKRKEPSSMEYRVPVVPLKRFIAVDKAIIRNTTVQKRYFIKDIIQEYKNVLS